MSDSTSYEIEVIDQQNLLQIPKEDLIGLAEQVLLEHGIRDAEIHVLLVDNPTIHAMNQAHLQHDFATDVITFPMNDPGMEPPDFPLEGEIVISTEMAAEIAASLGWDPILETKLYLIHGLLHLCGYDDLEEALQIEMRQREFQMLKLLEIETSPTDDRWKF